MRFQYVIVIGGFLQSLPCRETKYEIRRVMLYLYKYEEDGKEAKRGIFFLIFSKFVVPVTLLSRSSCEFGRRLDRWNSRNIRAETVCMLAKVFLLGVVARHSRVLFKRATHECVCTDSAQSLITQPS